MSDGWNVWFGPGPGKRRPVLQPRKRVDLHQLIVDAEPAALVLYPHQEQMIRFLTGLGEFDTNDPCDEWAHPHFRPSEPVGEADVWYRGWKVGWDQLSEFFTGEGWTAYKGGCDLDVPRLTAGRYQNILNEIDEHEDEV